MKRRIAVVTTSRADFSHLVWPLKELLACDGVDLRVIACAAQLSPEFGSAVDEIVEAGVPVHERVECLLSSDTDVGMAKTIGVAALGFAEVLSRMRPDVLLLVADRYEMLAPAAVATALRIPIAHMEGGEVSEGAIDDAVRNALTKLSHLHFTPTKTATRRVLAMGEEPRRVHRTGAPSLDHLRRAPTMTRAEVEAALKTDLSGTTALVAYHPLTLAADTLVETDAFFEALKALPARILFCFPNADAGGRSIASRARAFAATRPGTEVFVNLKPNLYLNLLRRVDLLLGNSSSGIMESPSFELPTVDVGDRQKGRERARNILGAKADAKAILDAATRALRPEFRASLRGMENPYGDGRASERIRDVLTTVPLGDDLLIKRAAPLPPTDDAS
jgi:UDP-hydrolysing UDP-N-acetyl-D-glucosamine 2-epimerase